MLPLDQIKRVEQMDKNILEQVVLLLKTKEAISIIGKGRQEQVDYIIMKMEEDIENI